MKLIEILEGKNDPTVDDMSDEQLDKSEKALNSYSKKHGEGPLSARAKERVKNAKAKRAK